LSGRWVEDGGGVTNLAAEETEFRDG